MYTLEAPTGFKLTKKKKNGMKLKKRGRSGWRTWEEMKGEDKGEFDENTVYTCMKFSKNKKYG